MLHFPKQHVMVALLALVVSMGGVGSAHAQKTQAAGQDALAAKVKAVNQAAESRYQTAAKEWQNYLSQLGSVSHFQKMAKEVASFDEKLAQGSDLLSGTTPNDRMRAAFRKHVLNEQTLRKDMVTFFDQFQEGLIKESVELYVAAGVDRKVAEDLFPRYRVDDTSWPRAFDSLIAKAKQLAQEDWWRTGLVTISSSLLADNVVEAGRQTGLWQHERGSWMDFLGGLIADYATEAALDYVTDPTDQFAEELQSRFRSAQTSLLNGKEGLLATLRKLTDLHLEVRNHHFSFVLKGAK
ncbi:MAG: hypothetical protein R3C28_32160 [Pirellulaceae bacterium]